MGSRQGNYANPHLSVLSPDVVTDFFLHSFHETVSIVLAKYVFESVGLVCFFPNQVDVMDDVITSGVKNIVGLFELVCE